MRPPSLLPPQSVGHCSDFTTSHTCFAEVKYVFGQRDEAWPPQFLSEEFRGALETVKCSKVQIYIPFAKTLRARI